METALDCSSEPMLLRRLLLLLRLPSDPVLVKVFLERRVSALCRLQSIRSDPIDSAMFRLLVSSSACLGKHLSFSGIPIWCLSSFGFLRSYLVSLLQQLNQRAVLHVLDKLLAPIS